MSSMGIPVLSLTSMAKAVCSPWPWGDVPVRTVTLPSGRTSTAPNSGPGMPLVIST